MTNGEVLVAQEEIRRLKARYCRFLDTKQWEKWGDLFTPDATVAAAGDDHFVHTWNAGNGAPYDVLKGHATAEQLAMARSGRSRR